MERDQDERKEEQVRKSRSVPARKQSTELSKVEAPGKLKRKAGKKTATRGGQPVGRKHLKGGDAMGGDTMRDVHVPGSIDEVG